METIKNTALLVMDMQKGISARYPNATEFVNNLAKAISHARKNNIPVIYVVVGFRQGMPEVSVNNKSFSTMKQNSANVDMNEFMQVASELAPQENEVIVQKRRISAFAGSDLEVILRAYNINHLVLSGIATSGVVLSTTREAADKDFRLTVLSDGCADRDEEVHHVLITKIFPRQAEVITIEEWGEYK